MELNKEYKLEDFTLDSFPNGTIELFSYEGQMKCFRLVFSYLNLISGGCLYGCTITISDWCGLDMLEYDKQQKIKQYDLDHIFEKNRIIDFSFNNNELILTYFEMHDATAIDYKFTKPKIQITGKYNPD